MKTLKFIIITLIFLSLPLFSHAKNIQDYINKTYSRYSKHFDKNGWKYSQPTYSITDKRPNTAREWTMFASYYYNKNDAKSKKMIKFAINNAILELQNRPMITQSFNDSIAHFLIIQKIDLLNNSEKNTLFSQIKESLIIRHNINDTENRGIISGVIDSYLANKLLQEKQIDKATYKYLIRKNKHKISKSNRQCIDKNNWYFEGKQKYYSVHYHTLTTYFLMFYGDYFNNKKNLNIAKKMTSNVRKITFHNGFIEARIGMRPIGLGAQTYLMLGILNKRFNYKDYNVYLNYTKNRFFSDTKHPNRLEFHSTVETTDPSFHDDIGFSLIAEISKLDQKIGSIKFKKHPTKLILKSKIYKDNRFTIHNNGEIIKINNKELRLSTNGEYSKIRTIKLENN